ncbi:hypothetical protein IG631_08890 [Alternaria alternata]|nr:hypothetical protein IG631_08890 [Alternaria alternata]
MLKHRASRLHGVVECVCGVEFAARVIRLSGVCSSAAVESRQQIPRRTTHDGTLGVLATMHVAHIQEYIVQGSSLTREFPRVPHALGDLLVMSSGTAAHVRHASFRTVDRKPGRGKRNAAQAIAATLSI